MTTSKKAIQDTVKVILEVMDQGSVKMWDKIAKSLTPKDSTPVEYIP